LTLVKHSAERDTPFDEQAEHDKRRESPLKAASFLASISRFCQEKYESGGGMRETCGTYPGYICMHQADSFFHEVIHKSLPSEAPYPKEKPDQGVQDRLEWGFLPPV
jgi:hypothetical protein